MQSICFQTAAPGVSVAQVARRYVCNAIMVFKWLRDPPYAPEPVSSRSEEERFLPVEIVTEAQAPVTVHAPASYIEIELAGGPRMRISGSHEPEALARLIRGLTA